MTDFSEISLMHALDESCAYIQLFIKDTPRVGIILGSGLSSLSDVIDNIVRIPYADIPHFSQSTVEGHPGNLLCGTIAGVSVLVMQGRFHYYEGYSMNEVVYPVRVMKKLGLEYLFVSNACGGLNPNYRTGDLMIITDHINAFPEHPLRGKNIDKFGERFPDMSETYNQELIGKARAIAEKYTIPVHVGVYVGSSGPTLETPAEYRMFRLLGADVTGMSTVPEVIVAHHAGIKVFGMSVVTNESKDAEQGLITSHADVQKNAELSGPRVQKIMCELIKEL
ncbi:MAG: purine-nucleoside phosphorylase [Bacteroidales bacterium]|jgi:purine-nucleoside phosphorylase|nr:purine-nucleoside phosphorylase [Bacteroidales bacterium]